MKLHHIVESIFLDSLRAQQTSVFMCEGVIILPRFMLMSSINGKFILHSRVKPTLIYDVMRELNRSIRMKWFFLDNPENPYYIPRFYVQNPEWKPPAASDTIEEAIFKMEEALVKQVPNLPQHAHLLYHVLRASGIIYKIDNSL